MTSRIKLIMKIALAVLAYVGLEALAYAGSGGASGGTASGAGGIGGMAHQVTSNLANVAKLITAGAYVAGFGFVVAGIVKFKAHKDNPQQVHISLAIVLVFVGAALIFVPSVFSTTGKTMFSGAPTQATVSGVQSF